MRLFVLFLCVFACVSNAAPKKTDAQIKEQRTALKKLESDLAKKREELQLLESEERGVLNTISLLDQNLSETRVYISELSKSELMEQRSLVELSSAIDSLDKKIEERKIAMGKRIRTLYVNGRFSEAEILIRLLAKKENPERQIYFIHRILNEDRERVETLSRMVSERDEKRLLVERHLAELASLREKKSREESGLVKQMGREEQVLLNLKHDKAMQKRALQEFERNQKTMLALIEKLEKKRKREIEEAKKAEANRKKKKGKTVVKPKKTVASSVKGPKCMPLEGEIISNYGLQEHPVLHIATRNLGIEIRGKRGASVRSAAAGTVVMVSEIDGRGPSVIIEHEGGTYSVYGHLRSIRVQEGKQVRNCEEIGEVGDIASLNGIKLYFQVSEGTQTVDPLQWLKLK